MENSQAIIIDREQAERFCGRMRFDWYLQLANGDTGLALALYRWNNRCAGVVHEQIGYVEAAVRNTIDRQLAAWNLSNCGSASWTDVQTMPKIIRKLLHAQISDAQNLAGGKNASHDQVVECLMWGSWVKLVGLPQKSKNSRLQQNLWRQSLYKAFPNIHPGRQSTDLETDRQSIARKLQFLRNFRNRAAHFKDLTILAGKEEKLINNSLSLLAAIDPSFVTGWFSPAAIRNIVRLKPAI